MLRFIFESFLIFLDTFDFSIDLWLLISIRLATNDLCVRIVNDYLMISVLFCYFLLIINAN